MSLSNAYIQSTKRLPDVFQKIKNGQAPDRFTLQLLKDWGFKSTNDRAYVPLLKSINFLTADGVPTQRYHDYRDHSRSEAVMAEALREAYEDLFLISETPSASEKASYEGKFKSFHNTSENVASLMTKTFLALLDLADFNANESYETTDTKDSGASDESPASTNEKLVQQSPKGFSGLHYNIQIHLPATKDLEVYNAIFKSLKEHLID